MHILYAVISGASLATAPAPLAQSSNTSSNSSSNNGVVRERIVDSYCDRDRYEARRGDRSESRRSRDDNDD